MAQDFQVEISVLPDQEHPFLLCPCFTIPKIVLEDGTIAEVPCVWGCTIDGLNATLYSPGFMLPTCSDTEDEVVKWLSINVGEYLDQGSPVSDYTTQAASCFIMTEQGDIDVGQHFNNYMVHPLYQYCLGVRYTYTDNTKSAVEKDVWLLLNCCPFGLASLPYVCVQGESRNIE